MSTYNGIKELSVFIECSTGNTPTVEALKKYIDLLSAFGYTQLYLGLTDAYKMEGEPYFNFGRGGYTTEQLQEIDAYAEKKNIELRVNIQVLGHMPHMKHHDCYRELFDTASVLMVGKEEVYEFIDKIFATMSKGVKSRVIHIGMDEAHDLGLGRYLKEHGYVDKRVLFLEHLKKVVEIAKKYQYTCEIWSDMFYRFLQGSDFNDDGSIPTDIAKSIPEGVKIVHWTYNKQTDEVLNRQIMQNKALCNNMTLAGSAWKCMGMAPDNKYSIDVIEHQITVCQKHKVECYMVTMWSDSGAHASIFSVLPTLFATAEMVIGKTRSEIDKQKFMNITGVAFDDFMLLDNLNNPFFKELDRLNSRSYWGLFSDMMLGNYDLLLNPHTNAAYSDLAERYKEVNAGDFQLMFEVFYLYAKILSIKMNLGVNIRNAYHENRNDLLAKFAKEDIPEMIERMQTFIEKYEKLWLSENMVFGLETHHLFLGGQIARWQYTIRTLEKHLEDGTPIEEMEREEMPPCIIPPVNEDNCLEMNYRNLISHCNI